MITPVLRHPPSHKGQKFRNAPVPAREWACSARANPSLLRAAMTETAVVQDLHRGPLWESAHEIPGDCLWVGADSVKCDRGRRREVHDERVAANFVCARPPDRADGHRTGFRQPRT